MTDDRTTALACLQAMSSARADGYDDWIRVGMALHSAGCSVQDWDSWSRRSAKWKEGECERKWQSFSGNAVSVGTLVQMARDDGGDLSGIRIEHRPVIHTPKKESAPVPVLDQKWIEPAEIPKPDLLPEEDLYKYLKTLFKPSEFVAYVTETIERDGKITPGGKGTYTRKAGEILDALEAQKPIHEAIQAKTGAGGAWIRINPMDGNGVTDANVTDHRFALVESDRLDLEQQFAIYKELKIPIAAVVHSGKKSLHAIVRIDAGQDFDLYRERVNRLYEVLKKNRFDVDAANRNPSRLSRMPGIERDGVVQYLVSGPMGMSTWQEWDDYLACLTDEMPPFESALTLYENPPELAPELIHGVLRRGHKMLLSGPSKAGKSFAMVQLAVALANGREWFGHKCEESRVVYINLEIDRPSIVRRLVDVANEMGAKDLSRLDVWNLRGKACGLATLIPKLLRRMNGKDYGAVIIDPLYMLLDGQDENSNGEMAVFLRELDRIAEKGASIVFASHYSKGAQGGKAAIDRTSGAGTLGRFPDAIVCLSEAESEDWDDRDGNPFVVEWILREFRSPPAQRCAFRWPVHVLGQDGQWAGLKIKGSGGRPATIARRDFDSAVLAYLEKGQTPTIQQLAGDLAVSDDTIRRLSAKLGFAIVRGRVCGKTNEKPEG